MISAFAAHAVPAIWGACAFYLIFGTKRVAPLIYPMGMGVIASLLWLAANEVPVILTDHGLTPELVQSTLLIAAGLVAVEIAAHVIHRNDLGHRSRVVAAIASRIALTVEKTSGPADTDNSE